MNNKKDIHIRVLDYGLSKGSGFTFAELAEDLKLEDLEKSLIWNEIQGADIVARSGKYRIKDNTDWNNEIFILSFESRFKHLQYIALDEARKSGRSAIRLSVVSLIVSVLISLYTFWSSNNSDLTWKNSEIQTLQLIEKNTSKGCARDASK